MAVRQARPGRAPFVDERLYVREAGVSRRCRSRLPGFRNPIQFPHRELRERSAVARRVNDDLLAATRRAAFEEPTLAARGRVARQEGGELVRDDADPPAGSV